MPVEDRRRSVASAVGDEHDEVGRPGLDAAREHAELDVDANEPGASALGHPGDGRRPNGQHGLIVGERSGDAEERCDRALGRCADLRSASQLRFGISARRATRT